MREARKFRWSLQPRLAVLAVGLALLFSSGCTTFREWVHNWLKVGPNYVEPPIQTPETWTAASDPRIHSEPDFQCRWWTVFNDPVLDALIEKAYENNRDVQKASVHLLDTRAQWCIDLGNLLPQSQSQTANYLHAQISQTLLQSGIPNIFNIWAQGPYVSWEIDIWGRLRRTAESDRGKYEASIADYHDVLVMLLSDVATNYIQLRGSQQRLVNLHKDLELEDSTVQVVTDRFKRGFTTELDVEQAKASRAQAAAKIPPVRTDWQKANNRLCTLLGEPVHDLAECLDFMPIPTVPTELVVGIPANVVRRRPDVRRAEREAAAQCAQIGVAEADWYPAFSVLGFLGQAASSFNDLFDEKSLTAFVGPGISWKILNYGRIYNNVKMQDARLKQKILAYQQAVLKAGEEADTAIVAFLNSQEQLLYTQEAVQADEKSAQLSMLQYTGGQIAFDRALNAETTLAQQRDALATSQQDHATNLVKIYKALGGGWECFKSADAAGAAAPPPVADQVAPATVPATPPADRLPPPTKEVGDVKNP